MSGRYLLRAKLAILADGHPSLTRFDDESSSLIRDSIGTVNRRTISTRRLFAFNRVQTPASYQKVADNQLNR